MRLTHPAVRQVMRIILEAPSDDLAWVGTIYDQTDLGPGTAIPAIHTLELRGWITMTTLRPGPEGQESRTLFSPTYDAHWYETRMQTPHLGHRAVAWAIARLIWHGAIRDLPENQLMELLRDARGY